MQGFRAGEDDDWGIGVLDNICRHSSKVTCRTRLNELKIYAVSPGFVLQRIVIYPVGQPPAASYLGPPETYYVGMLDH